METSDVRYLEKKFMSEVIGSIKESWPNLFDMFVIKQSTEEEDTKLSFDVIVCGVPVSVRIRKYVYQSDRRYFEYDGKPSCLTIRSKSKGSRRTEIDKLKSGSGKIYFYAWMDATEEYIIKWILIDIDKIRDKLFDNGKERDNHDGTMLKTYSYKFLNDNNAIINKGKNKIKL